jgi:predicted metalloprotease with PDZ domain
LAALALPPIRLNTIPLAPLSRRASRALVDEILRRAETVPSELRERVVEAADGNPFYVEEMIQVLIDDGVIVRDEPRWRVRLERVAGVQVPPTLTAVLQKSGRLKQSVADSSFDAWIKYYRQDENAPNSVVSYYQKGALVALALDLTIRAGTRQRKSLDDVMRHLWRQWVEAGDEYAGVDEDGILAAAEAATGLALARTLSELTEGTRDPDFARLLAPFGIRCETRPALESPHFAMLGIKLADGKVQHVYDGSPAQQAGLSAGDVLVALDGLRASEANLDTLLARYRPGDTVPLHAFRRDALLCFDLTLATRAPPKFALTVDPKAPKSAQAARTRWLGA